MRLPLMSVIFFCLSSYFVHAQSPDKLSFQAVIRDSTGGLVLNQSVGLQMSILQGSVSGSSVYTETHSPTTNSIGLISIEIGGGTTITGAFSSIDWSNGPYYLKREVDPAGGTNYTISGTSQLMSVPYAMYATIADTVLKVPDVSSTNEIQTISKVDRTVTLSNDGGTFRDSVLTEAQVDVYANNNGYLTSEVDGSITNEIQNLLVSTSGDTLYISGGNYVIVPGISARNYPWPSGIVFCGDTTEIVDVYNPTTGKTWMDRNLGASQVATSSTDAASYGDLYQWGRAADGHQCRSSGTTTTLATSDKPGHGDFIVNRDPANGNLSVYPYDWLSPQNDNLWQGVNGTNNPCPSGYRLPTEAEWQAEFATWSSPDDAGAFASLLKLPKAGERNGRTGIIDSGSRGHYKSSNVDGHNDRQLTFQNMQLLTQVGNRQEGMSVRCIKD